MFRGDKKALNDERGFAATLTKIQKGGLRLQRWLIALLIFLLMSLVVINSYSTGQFRIVRFGAMAQSKENTHGESPPLVIVLPLVDLPGLLDSTRTVVAR